MYSRYVVRNSTRTRSSAPAKVVTQTVPALTVWAAAAYAHRINDGYYKDGSWESNDDGTQRRVREPNRDLMNRALENTNLLTEQDLALGQAAHAYHSQTMVMQALRSPLSDFQMLLSRVCALDEIASTDRYTLAVIGSQIAGYLKSVEQDQVRSLIDPFATPVGQVGDKVDLAITVVRSNYSMKYMVYFVNAVTATGQPVFFSHKNNLPTGSQHQARGTVKAIRPDATQLTRVKLVKEIV